MSFIDFLCFFYFRSIASAGGGLAEFYQENDLSKIGKCFFNIYFKVTLFAKLLKVIDLHTFDYLTFLSEVSALTLSRNGTLVATVERYSSEPRLQTLL